MMSLNSASGSSHLKLKSQLIVSLPNPSHCTLNSYTLYTDPRMSVVDDLKSQSAALQCK
jgi:hypothetical protein